MSEHDQPRPASIDFRTANPEMVERLLAAANDQSDTGRPPLEEVLNRYKHVMDVASPNLKAQVEVIAKAVSAYTSDLASQTSLDDVIINVSGESFVDGSAWAYALMYVQHSLALTGRIKEFDLIPVPKPAVKIDGKMADELYDNSVIGSYQKFGSLDETWKHFLKDCGYDRPEFGIPGVRHMYFVAGLVWTIEAMQSDIVQRLEQESRDMEEYFERFKQALEASFEPPSDFV